MKFPHIIPSGSIIVSLTTVDELDDMVEFVKCILAEYSRCEGLMVALVELLLHGRFRFACRATPINTKLKVPSTFQQWESDGGGFVTGT
jgi:hypothetical protein